MIRGELMSNIIDWICMIVWVVFFISLFIVKEKPDKIIIGTGYLVVILFFLERVMGLV